MEETMAVAQKEAELKGVKADATEAKKEKNTATVVKMFGKASPAWMRVRVTFVDEVLGTASGDPDIHGKYIASLNPDAQTRQEEIEAIGEDEFRAKGKTVFPKNSDGEPIFWNYQWKGFFKSACSALRTVDGTISSKTKAYVKKIDQQIFVFADVHKPADRMITIHTDEPIGECQRPLRAKTMQGERVAIADSEAIAPGAWCEFDIMVLNPADLDLVREWMGYGLLNGMGQWRNSGKGSYVWEEIG